MDQYDNLIIYAMLDLIYNKCFTAPKHDANPLILYSLCIASSDACVISWEAQYNDQEWDPVINWMLAWQHISLV